MLAHNLRLLLAVIAGNSDLSETGQPATGAWVGLPLQQIAAKNAGSWVCGLADSASTNRALPTID